MQTRKSKCLRQIALGLAALAGMSLTNSANALDPVYTFKAITSIGSPAPGGGAYTNDFEPTRLNNLGVLAFTAEPDVPGEEATFLAYPNGNIIQMMRFGQPAPGGGTFSTFELGNIGLNNAGDAAFAFTLEPLDFGPPIYGGVYRWSHWTRTLKAILTPNVTPDPNGGFFVGAHFCVSLNEFGFTAFTGFVTNTPVGLNYGVFIQSPFGRISNVVRPGDQSPDGGTFLNAGNPVVLNNLGDILFEGQTTVDAGPNYHKIYIKHLLTGALELIPQPTGVANEASMWINDFGQVAFGGNFDATAIGSGNGAIYLRSRGTTIVLAKTGDPAPGGGNFSFITGVGIQGQLGLNNWGNVAFEAATDTKDEAVYFYTGFTKTLRRLVGIGDSLPGIGTITSLEQGSVLTFPPVSATGFPLSNMTLNDRNQLSFAATVVQGTNVNQVLLLGTPLAQFPPQNQDQGDNEQ